MVPENATSFAVTAVFLNDGGTHQVDYLKSLATELNSVSDSFAYVSPNEIENSNWLHISQTDNSSHLDALMKASKSGALPQGDILLLSDEALISAVDASELITVLKVAEKHGVVGTRSRQHGQGQIPARVPFANRQPMESMALEQSADLFALYSKYLPEYSVVKQVDSAVIAISHKALLAVMNRDYPSYFIDRWSELCREANTVGYSAIQANNVFVETTKQHFQPVVTSTARVKSVNGIDQFSAVIESNHTQTDSLFIDLFNLDRLWNGTSRNAISFLTALYERKSRADEFPTVVLGANNDVRQYFDLDRFGFEVRSRAELEGLVFHAGFALAPLTHPRQLFRMNELCARWILSHLDIIALRTLALSETDPAISNTVRDSIVYADRIIAISQFTKNDLLAYFPELAQQISPKIQVCLEGADRNLLKYPSPKPANYSSLGLPESHNNGYVLVVGNSYPHKQLDPALNTLENLELPIVVLGQAIAAKSNIVGFASGSLSERNIAELFSSAKVVVYPSSYEGYGLPVADAALFGKPIALFDTEIAREVTTSMNAESNTSFFSDFTQLPELVSKLYQRENRVTPQDIRTLEEFNNDVVGLVLEAINDPIDLEVLNKRYEYVTSLESYALSPRLQTTDIPNNLLFRKIKTMTKKILGR